MTIEQTPIRSYTAIIRFKDYSDDLVIESIGHSIIEPQVFSIIDVDAKRYLIPISSILYIEFDSRLNEVLTRNENV
jgi:hypothetical protein